MYGIRHQRVFSTDSFGSSGEKQIRVLIFLGGGEEAGGSNVATVLLLSRIGFRKSKESQENALL